MNSKLLFLRFPKTEAQQPTICNLARQFDLTFNILKATILPRKEGIMVLELSGERKNFKKGIQYLKEHGVHVQDAGQEVRRDDEKCMQCGACTAVCITGALAIERPAMVVRFNHKKCSACGLCVPACPSRAMEIKPIANAFFK